MEDLTPMGADFHCHQCDKKVLDFRSKDKETIIAELSRYKETPCVSVSNHVLEPMPDRLPIWRHFRKSAAFITLFFMLSNVKDALAQTIQIINDRTQDTIPTPNGYQRITLIGSVYNDMDNGEGVPKANLFICFDGEVLTQCPTDINGSFECAIENYGGIREITILVRADNYFSKDLVNIPILKEKSTIHIPLQKKGTIFIQRRQEVPISMGAIAVERPRINNTAITKFFDIPLRVMDDIYPTKSPQSVDKLHFPIGITDNNEKPIPNAKVEMYLSSGEMRWGITNQYGFVNMRAQLNEKASYAQIVITADGYFRKTFYDFELENKKSRTIKIRKKPEKNSRKIES